MENDENEGSVNKTNTCRDLVLYAPLRWPPASTSLQKGEFWHYDTTFLAIDGTFNNAQLKAVHIVCSYDIACQWNHNGAQVV
ncbi:hypothetical protein DFH06DRAFT_1315594 [Mycena polygramma]|nr:hypothetical protein DFH06DRAFT_1315594 [Mycena polygramma]